MNCTVQFKVLNDIPVFKKNVLSLEQSFSLESNAVFLYYFMYHCIKYIVSGILYQVYCTRYIVSGIFYQVHCIKYIVSGILYQVY